MIFEFDWQAVSLLELPSPAVLSKLPAVQRDLAIVVKHDLPAQFVLDTMLAAKQAFVQKITLFDEFRSKAINVNGNANVNSSMDAEEKSLAFRITLLNPDETLHDEQVDTAIAALLANLEKKCGARLR